MKAVTVNKDGELQLGCPCRKDLKKPKGSWHFQSRSIHVVQHDRRRHYAIVWMEQISERSLAQRNTYWGFNIFFLSCRLGKGCVGTSICKSNIKNWGFPFLSHSFSAYVRLPVKFHPYKNGFRVCKISLQKDAILPFPKVAFEKTSSKFSAGFLAVAVWKFRNYGVCMLQSRQLMDTLFQSALPFL